ncbi:hypothetical protein JZ751_007623 [Albula glossodonta]|uniref:Interferon gamma n=1 Tax=Albula glossodonta TaxID=121402 RepID=A0A8T2N1V5_9TELE|nr:hypothetical protein JZ751_007623 [Albula glossodonta]
MSLVRCLTLFCGACFVTLGSSIHIPRIQQDIKKLREHFHEKGSIADSKWYGNPVFLKIPDVFESNLEESEKKLLVREMLEVSIKVLSKLMNSTKDVDVRSTVLSVRGQVETLKQNYFQDKTHILQTRLRELWATKDDDFITQRKVLKELSVLCSKAQKLGSGIHQKKEQRRRRRQVFRKRTPLL